MIRQSAMSKEDLSMLRRQSPDRTPMSFLAGRSEMSKRMREFDWIGHPIGTPECWPQSLRSALGICLNSAFPTAIYWGSELRLLYNDPWSQIPGPRHPGCLGAPAKEVWSDIWHVIEPQFTTVIETGEGIFVDDQFLPMRRFGFVEETYWSYSFTPIRGEDGTIEGIFNSGQETTAKVLKQRQTAFLLRLSDRLRAHSDVEGVMEEGCRLLGEHLGAIRIGIREMDREDGQLNVRLEWTADGTDQAGPGLPWSKLGSIARRLEEGHAVRIERTDALDRAEARELWRLGAAAVLALPWRQSGKLGAVLFVHRPKAQHWTDEEVATAEQVFARLMQALDRQRSKEREQTLMLEIDHRARNMLGISQALIRMTPAEDVGTLRKSLLDRTRALGNTLQILSESRWAGANLETLLEHELAPFICERTTSVSIQGPMVLIPPLKAQPFSMAFHELVTNAVKYGALSSSEGHIEVSWTVRPDGMLELLWLERNVQPDAGGKSASSGFGTKLLEMTIETQLDGKLFREISDGDFRCMVEVPLFPSV
jgi:two-component sensor histidine kinase